MKTITIPMNRKPYNMEEVKQNEFSSNTECCVVKKKYVSNKVYKNLVSDFYQDNDIYEKIGGGTDYTRVIQIINEETQETYFVNTEGYNYARYVGIIKQQNKHTLSFEDWFNNEKDNLIELFCSFIKESKVYDCTLDMFVRHLYTETIHYKKNNS